MGDTEARLCKLFKDKLKTSTKRFSGATALHQHVIDLDTKFTDQASRINQVEEKVDLLTASLGHGQQEQLHVAHALTEFHAPRVEHSDHHGPRLMEQLPPLPPPRFHIAQVNFPNPLKQFIWKVLIVR